MSGHWDLRMYPWDRKTPRFHPPGKHPAMARTYEELRRAERVAADFAIMGPEVGREFFVYLGYLRQQVADFEGRESELKAAAALRGRSC